MNVDTLLQYGLFRQEISVGESSSRITCVFVVLWWMVKKLPVFKDKPDKIAEFLIEYSDVSWGKFEKFVGTETPLVGRMKSAFEFRVTFENDTSVVGPLLDAANPEFDISCRMLYQLFTDKENVPWTTFADRLKSLPLYIEEVMDAVAKLKKIDNMEGMTVILCVDGLQS
ncbi:Aste57867_3632 [Aphanomyces stellatus]|uniref:Aste57867_3632 protein n=1 Tax=Aphanomyces stellatus TaxID=120398 RepID=A0A485KBS1_9STRA|nr:hypothetical protein As57867_003621 [Aphanomyces stellatus]VFT80791.1 Aste57867_3632 [Aphanomyces stellatus]